MNADLSFKPEARHFSAKAGFSPYTMVVPALKAKPENISAPLIKAETCQVRFQGL